MQKKLDLTDHNYQDNLVGSPINLKGTKTIHQMHLVTVIP